MLRVGLTGGIACGKSQVLRRLAVRGLPTIDLDVVARDVTAPGRSGFDEIVRAFGDAVVDPTGGLDRAALAARVFERTEELQRLNAIVHPRVRVEEAHWFAELEARGEAVAVADGALLVESGVHLRFDRLVVVHCEPGRQLARLLARDHLDEAGARQRIAAQMPVEEKRRYAHYAIDSSGTLEEMDRATDRLADELRELAQRPLPSVRPLRRRLCGALAHGPRHGPRGLSPATVLESIRERGGLEMAAVAERLSPPAGAPWYRAAMGVRPGAAAATLGAAVVAWALSRGGPDPPFLAAAAASLARLTHEEASARVDACLFALVLQELLTCDESGCGLDSIIGTHMPIAQRWGGGASSGALDPVWSSARQHLADPPGAAAACGMLGGEPALAAAIAGAAAGPPEDHDSFLEQALTALGL